MTSPPARWVRVLGALVGAAIGWGAWEAAARSLPEADGDWILRGASVPLEAPTSSGPLRSDPAALDLWAYRGASPRLPPFADGTVTLRARVPDDGQLLVRFGAETTAGPEQPVRIELDRAAGRGPALPPPKPAGAGVQRPPEQGATLIVDRSARAAIFGRNLTCDPAPAPPERFQLGVEARGGTLTVSVDGRPVTRCRGAWGPGALVLGAGVRRVQVDDVAVTAGGATLVEDFGGPARAPFAGALLALVGALLGTRLRRGYALALLPTLLLPLLGRLDVRGLLDTLRLLEVPDALGPPLLVGVPAVTAAVLVAGARASSLQGAAVRGLLGLAPAAVAAALAPPDAAGWLLLGALGVLVAALGWVNTHPFARRVPASWALVALLVLGAEGAVRLTALNTSWTRTAGWRRASEEFAELVELRRWRTYPDEGFPVRPPEPDPARQRIVALGGSSTGGAWQMDDIAQFWPKRLEERLPAGWEVVNQGVGGWNTLHVRLYLESQIERLAPDILVLYVGHNDILSTAPVPYRDLYARWQDPSSGVRAVADALNGSRLYVGLKYALLALRAREGAVAVPVTDARDNLAAILDLARGHGARVMLVTEGLNPDPLPMRPYGAMQAALAAESGALYLDGADLLWRAGDPDLFLDDCHLSVPGHTRLAGWIHDALDAAGWLGAPSPGAPSPGAPSPGAPSPGAPSPGAPSPGAPSPGAPNPGAPSPGAPAPPEAR